MRTERINVFQRTIGAFLAIHIIALPQNVASLLHPFLLVAVTEHLEVKTPLDKLRPMRTGIIRDCRTLL